MLSDGILGGPARVERGAADPPHHVGPPGVELAPVLVTLQRQQAGVDLLCAAGPATVDSAGVQGAGRCRVP